MKMKPEILNLIRQLESSYNGRPWYGESLLQKLEGIGPKEAFAVPVTGVHSVAQITAHILVWRRVLAERLKGEPGFKVEIDSAADWPSTAALQEKGWSRILAELADNQRELISLLSSAPDDLPETVFSGSSTYRELIEGILQHDVYHIGQIGLVLSISKNQA